MLTVQLRHHHQPKAFAHLWRVDRSLLSKHKAASERVIGNDYPLSLDMAVILSPNSELVSASKSKKRSCVIESPYEVVHPRGTFQLQFEFEDVKFSNSGARELG